jgi:hypothetical protein
MEPIALSLEQQFALRSFADQVDRMSHEQAQEFLVKLYEQMMIRDTLMKELIKKDWGLAEPPTLSGMG